MSEISIQDASNNILIIDDSNEICSLLVSGIISGCAETSRTCRVVQSGPFGMIETIPLNFSINVFDDKFVNVFTANSPRNALSVLNMPTIRRLTIICDIMMPNDTEVGLPGLLRELSRLRMPVNLVFATSEGQNRGYVEKLLNSHKAFFLEKGTSPWNQLPYALVEKSDLFHYHLINLQDFERQPVDSPELAPALNGAKHKTQKPTLPEAVVHNSLNEDESSRNLKSSTGLLKMLTFWRR